MDLFKLVGTIAIDNKDAEKTIKETTESAGGMASAIGGKMQQAGSTMMGIGKAILPASAAIGAVGVAAVKTSADFEAEMSKVKAISGASGDDMIALSDKAKEMGAKTKFSASESAQAMQYMGMAGWKAGDMIDGLEGIMDLAAASGTDLGRTSDIVTDALTAFGLSAKDSGDFADVMAQASTNANTNVDLLGESFKYCASTAGAMGYDFRDVTESLGLMANAGVKGSQAGTTLKTAMINLAKPTEKMQKAMDKYNISLTDNDGNMKSWNEVVDDLRTNLGGLAKDEQTAAVATIFGKEATAGMLSVINAAPADIEKMNTALHDSEGAAKSMADEMNNNLNGQITILKSSIEGLMISLGDILLPVIKNVVSGIQNFVTWLNNLDEGTKEIIVKVGSFIAVLAPVLIIVGKIISVVGTVVSGISSVITVVKGLTAGTGLLSSAIGFLTSPIGLVIGAVTALVGVFTYLYNTNEEFREFVNNAWENIKEAISTACEAVVQWVSDTWNAIKETVSSVGQAISNAVSTAWNAIKTAVSTVLEGIKTAVSTAWNAIKTSITTIINNIKTTVTTVWNNIKTAVTTAVNNIKTTVTTIWNNIKTTITTVLNNIKTTATNIWNEVKNTITTVTNNIKTAISTTWNNIKSTLSTTWSNIKSTASTAWDGIKTTISNAINNVKNTISTGMNSAKTTVSTVLNSIKSSFSTIWEGCKTAVSTAIGAIKGMMNFSWSLPPIKLPHFSISGEFSLNPPSIPHISVSWYKKAVDNPYLFTEPTMFGFNPMTATAKIAGETEPEIMYGKDNLLNDISVAVASQNSSVVDAIYGSFEQLFGIMEEYFPQFGRQMVLDTGVLVSELAEPMDRELGKIYRRRGR